MIALICIDFKGKETEMGKELPSIGSFTAMAGLGQSQGQGLRLGFPHGPSLVASPCAHWQEPGVTSGVGTHTHEL